MSQFKGVVAIVVWISHIDVSRNMHSMLMMCSLPALLVRASCFHSNHGHPHEPVK